MFNKKKYAKEWRRTHKVYMREHARSWHKSHPEHRRKTVTLLYLKAALLDKSPIENGWPDDGFGVEVKCGKSTVRANQFRRFAQMRVKFGRNVQIRMADSSVQCARGKFEDVSIEGFLSRVCSGRAAEALSMWKNLLKKEKS